MTGDDDRAKADAFAAEASAPERGLVRELIAFVRDNGRWILVPILVVLLLVGILIALASTAAAPLIYPLF